MSKATLRRPSRRKESGLSLVLVLFAVLCLSFLIVLFFSLATNDRASTAAFTNSMRAEELGTGGLELVIAELRKEISDEDRSIINKDPQDKGPTVYIPRARKDIVPERTASDSLGNLVKISGANQTLFSGPTATLRGSSASSSTPSRNGRSVSAERWNKTALAQFSGTSTPAWIYLDRRGPVSAPVMADATDPAKPGFVLGRIAFAIYDLGGLLDANVAGYPAVMPEIEAARKGSPALIKLQALGLSDAAVEKIVDFRNSASKSDYKKYIDEGKHEGFTRTLDGDNRFVSRQELIRFAKRNGFEDKLKFLTVFSREKNSPSYEPPSAVQSNVNPSLATLRHAGSGRLLLEKRFPLGRLKLFQNPDDPVNAADILKYFGLTYDKPSRSFSYKSSTIMTLTQVAAEPDFREPDFFELLKGGIQAGSIGQSAGATAMVTDDPDKDTHIMQIGANIIDQYDLDPDHNSAGPIPIPTTIAFGAKTLYGVENLPYVNKIHLSGNGPTGTALQNDNLKLGLANGSKNLDGYSFRMSAELWNPTFQNVPTSSDYNPEIQVSMEGSLQVTLFARDNAQYTAGPGQPVGDNTPPWSPSGTPVNVSGTATISVNQATNQLQNSLDYFSEPAHVRLAMAMASTNYDKLRNQKNLGNADYLAFHFKSLKAAIDRPISVTLQVLDGNSVPRTYQKTLATAPNTGFTLSHHSSPAEPNGAAGNVAATTAIAHSDPRTNRLGYFGMDFRISDLQPGLDKNGQQTGSLPQFPSGFASHMVNAYSIRPKFSAFGMAGDATGNGVATTDGLTGSAYSSTNPHLYLGLLWENTLDATKAKDPDNNFRVGDGGFASSATAPVPFEPILSRFTSRALWPPSGSRPRGTNSSRPVVLDRPFRSVADLGYVYRDIPWRSLNFSSADSADSSLLDVFSIEDATAIAGRVNPNAASVDTLKALFAGSLKEEKGSTSDVSDISDEQALAIANRIKNFLSNPNNGPVVNVSEFVTQFSTQTNLTDAELGKGAGGESSFAIKTQRESLIRALAGTTQTRTWNFLIDLVAQTGRFPKGATGYDDFSVEGERRYWLHIAIDRYTGEVVSELLETVND